VNSASVPSCSTLFDSVLLACLVIYVAPPPFVNSDVIVNSVILCVLCSLYYKRDAGFQQGRRLRFIACIAFVLLQLRIHACTQCSPSPSCSKTHTTPGRTPAAPIGLTLTFALTNTHDPQVWMRVEGRPQRQAAASPSDSFVVLSTQRATAATTGSDVLVRQPSESGCEGRP
jgi:hypothetical protein